MDPQRSVFDIDFFGNRFSQAGSSLPAINISEDEKSYTVDVVSPGFKKEDFKINLDNGLLTVSFEKKEETENKEYKTIRKEFSFRSFKRSFNLDDKINTGGIQAKYENGVLKIYLPKKEEVAIAPQQIAIN